MKDAETIYCILLVGTIIITAFFYEDYRLTTKINELVDESNAREGDWQCINWTNQEVHWHTSDSSLQCFNKENENGSITYYVRRTDYGWNLSVLPNGIRGEYYPHTDKIKLDGFDEVLCPSKDYVELVPTCNLEAYVRIPK